MQENILFIPIIATFIGGLLTLFIPKKIRWFRELFTLAVLVFSLVFSVKIFIFTYSFGRLVMRQNVLGGCISLVATPLSSFILFAALCLTILVMLYSIKTMHNSPQIRQYYTYSLWAITASAIAVFSNNLIMLLVVWGAIAVLLYMLILMGKPGSDKAGYKALIMIGGSDVLMIIGAGIIYSLAGTMTLDQIRIPFTEPLAYIAFFLFLIGAATKAGVMPFHTWIVDSAETAPASVMALFPSVLDKLLGVYLLIRISSVWFIITPTSPLSIVLMSLGALTIIAGAGMALMQENLMKLLAYSTVSQVGYIVLGIGTATPIGVIGAMFHMFNNIIYKTGLFFAGGAVEMQTKEINLGRLGGLAKYMPITFITTLVAALSISGIPPLSGFVSKWLVYQSLIQMININPSQSWYLIIFLILAMLGSVITLAYFMKFLYSIFLSSRPKAIRQIKEVSWTTYLPMIILAIFTIAFGIFPLIPIKYFFAPAFGLVSIKPYGFYNPGLATILAVLGVAIGFAVFLFTRSRKVRYSEVFIGGESISTDAHPTEISEEETTIPGTDFYDSVKKIKFLSDTYQIADSKFFDIFEQARKFIALLVKAGRKIHNGLLQTYLGWLFLGVITIIAIFFLLLIK